MLDVVWIVPPWYVHTNTLYSPRNVRYVEEPLKSDALSKMFVNIKLGLNYNKYVTVEFKSKSSI